MIGLIAASLAVAAALPAAPPADGAVRPQPCPGGVVTTLVAAAPDATWRLGLAGGTIRPPRRPAPRPCGTLA